MLTPIDIQNHSLKTAVRGYSKKEVDDFLEEIMHSYEDLYRENRELKDKISSLSEGIQYYKNMESTLQKALVLAEKTSTETQEAAKSKADALMQETEAKSDAIQREAAAEAEALRKETQAYAEVMKSKAKQELEETRNHVRKLVQSYENYRLQFKKLAESQIEMLDSEHFSIFAPELAEMLDDAPDADEAMEAPETQPINDAQVFSELSGGYAAQDSTEEETATEESIFEDTDETEETNASFEDSYETEETNTSFEDADENVENDASSEDSHENEESDASFEIKEQPEEESIFIDDYPAAKTSYGDEAMEPYDREEETADTNHSYDDYGSYTLEDEEPQEQTIAETEHRVDDYQNDGVMSSVDPENKTEEDSPFIFIDTE